MHLISQDAFKHDNRNYSSRNITSFFCNMPATSNLPDDFVDKIQAPLFQTHDDGANLTYEWRIEQLKNLNKLIREKRPLFLQALADDLGRYPTESVCAEIIPVEAEVEYFLQNLKDLMKPEHVSTPMLMAPAKARVESKPLQPPGVLIIGPSNYPLQLVLKPLAGVLAGGNPCVIKPSELTPNVAKALHATVQEYFDPSVVSVVLGAVPETKALLSVPWAKVLFTGSERVGKLVAQACANTLTPCILECGGKSATVVDETVPHRHLQNVADRIVFAKFFNSGQVCIAPDTLFVHESQLASLKEALIKAIEAQFGKDPQTGEMARMVNKQNARRLVEIIREEEFYASTFDSDAPTNTLDKAEILLGGSKTCDIDQRYVAPTLVVNPSPDGRLVKEEIFGPILPIHVFATREEAIDRIRKMNKASGIPLFLYVFTTSGNVFKAYTDKCRSGGAVRNDVLIQLANTEQPLGGLGTSGYGRYFGKYSFDAFTHKFPVTWRPLGSFWDFGNLRCHPYEGVKSKMLEDFLLYLPKVPSYVGPGLMLAIPFTVCTVLMLWSAWPAMLPTSFKLQLASRLDDLAKSLRDSATR